MTKHQIKIEFDHWPDARLFPNKAGNVLHWAQRSALRKIHRTAAYYQAINQTDHIFEKASILICVTSKDNRQRDLDGFLTACKPFLDGIVDAGVLDDNYYCVGEITIIFNANIKEDTVSITIREEV